MPFIIALLLSLIYSSSSNAAGTYAPYASADKFYQSIKMNLDNLEASYQHRFDKQLPSNRRAPESIVKTIKYKPQELKNLLKLKSLTPAGFALTAVLTGAGYLIDEYGDVVEAGTVNPEYQEGFFWSSGSSWSFASTPSGTATLHRSVGWGKSYPFDISCSSSSLCNATFDRSSDSLPDTDVSIYRVSCSGYSGSQCPSSPPTTDPQPVSDEDFIEKVAPQIEWGDVVFDDATNPIPSPQYTDTINQINNWYTDNYGDENNNTTNTTTNTTTSTTVINNDGSETKTETKEETQPAFCQYAGIVCDLANWIMNEPANEPTPPQTPVETIDPSSLTVDWSSGMGSGSCPASTTTPFNGKTIVKDYTDECNAVSTVFKPILIFFSLVGAGFVVAGIKF